MRYVSRACCSLLVLIAGCITERVVWSPDGTRAAIVGDDGLHVCDVSGKLSPPLAPDVKCVDWMPDSKRLVVCRQRQLKTWQEANEAFPEETAAAGKHVEAVRAELAAATNGWPAFVENTKKNLQISNEQLAMALMALRDRPAEALALKLDKEGKEAYAAQSILDDQAQVYSVDETSATAGPTLYRRCTAGKGIQSMRVSPTGKAVLLSIDVSAGTHQGEPPQLLLTPIDAPGKNCDLERAAKYPDWSPDGKYVVFIRPADWNTDQSEALLGILSRQQVADSNGQLLDQARLPKREDLAGLLFDQLSRVRVAKDGRIFFSAAELSLPAAVKDIDTQPTVFSFEPGKQATLTRSVPRSAVQAIGNAAQYFELSPDARYLSVPYEDGRVSVLDIASGEAQLVQSEAEPESKDHLRLATIPEWRSATELTFVRPIPDSTAHEIVRYSVPDKSATVISADWPASIGNWLAAEPPKPETAKKDK